MRMFAGCSLALVSMLTCGLILVFAMPHLKASAQPRNFKETVGDICQDFRSSLSELRSLAQKNPTSEIAEYSAANPITDTNPPSANTPPVSPGNTCTDSSITPARTVANHSSCSHGYPSPSSGPSRKNTPVPNHGNNGVHATQQAK